jgi:hypothetical protein
MTVVFKGINQTGVYMSFEQLLNGSLRIQSIDDDLGRRYYSFQIQFSDKDVLTIYRNNIDDLMIELPKLMQSALRARITNNLIVN